MHVLQTIEIDGDPVGVLTHDRAEHSFYFYSGVAPYDLLDGSRFVRACEARAAIQRMSRAARPARRAGTTAVGDLR